MSSTTSPQTFVDCYTDLQNRVRTATSVTATADIAKRYICTALLDMHVGSAEKLPWAERTAVLITRAQYTTGTVTATQGSVTLSGTGTLWTATDAFNIAAARVGGKVIIGGSVDVYEVQAIGGAGTITLTTKYVGATVTDTSYIYFEDEYALATDFLRPFDFRSFSTGREVELISRSEFRRRYARNSIPGTVFVATILDKAFSGNTTPVRKVQLHRPPSTAVNIPYSYITSNLVVTAAGVAQENFSADSDEPIVPRRFRHGIVLHALEQWYRDLKDDTRSQEVAGEYNSFMLRMIGDSEIGENRPQFRPRMSPYVARAKRPWSGSRRRFDINNRFDRMED